MKELSEKLRSLVEETEPRLLQPVGQRVCIP
jgi:hypothetical protein